MELCLSPDALVVIYTVSDNHLKIMTGRRKVVQNHELNPFCYICNLFFSPDYMPTHLKTDHSKDELAAHLLLTYFDDWLDQKDSLQKALGNSSTKRR